MGNTTQIGIRPEQLTVGMIVRHAKSGKLYICSDVRPPMSPEMVADRIANGGGYNRTWAIGFYGLRDGKRFGPWRSLKLDQLSPVD